MRILLTIAVAIIGCTPPGGGGGKDKDGGGDPPPPTTPPPTTPPPTTPPPGDPATVTINEVMPGNWSTVNGPDGASMPDWVELVNTGDDPVPVERLELRNANGGVWTGGPDDGQIAPGEHLLVWLGYAEDDTEGLWTGFDLDKGEDELVLISDRAIVVETIDILDVPGDVSMMRIPDVTGDFVLTAWPTPGEVNSDEPSPTLDPADETFFRTDVVHRIDFTFTDEAYQRISESDRPEVHVEMAIDGIYYPDIGLKLKGSASYDTMDGKPAFIVDLNEWVTGTKYRGLKAFKLHNGNVLDPTRVRDHLSYKLAREAGLMAPRVGWAQVFCNKEDYGIYIVIEKHDDVFVEYHHEGQQDLGMVLEPNEANDGGWGWGDFGSGNLNWNYEEGPVPMPVDAQEAMIQADALISQAATDQRVEELWTWMNKDQALTFLAWETVIMHTDGYRAPNNWRVFIDGVTFQVEFLPSGAEWTWDYDVDTNSYGGAFGSWCLSNSTCKHDYAEKLVEVADLVGQLGLEQEFVDLQVWLDPLIQADPRYIEQWGETVESARASTSDHLARNPVDATNQACAQFPDVCP